jgi:hypothetical protein
MMAALREEPLRRGRYTRQPLAGPTALTPQKLALLAAVSELGIASLPQLAALAGPSVQSARRHLRVLFDEGLVHLVPVGRAALADPTRTSDPSLLYGSAPNIYTLTRGGWQRLQDLGVEAAGSVPPRYGPQNGLFLAHELAIRDVRVWLALAARQNESERLERWVDGAPAAIELGRTRSPRQVRPDAWFLYRVGTKALVGLVELDRGTERGSRRWEEKVAAYGALFAGDRLQELTGYANARVLVVTPTARRRDWLTEFIGGHAPPELAGRFWLAERRMLRAPDLKEIGWQQPGTKLLLPLLSQESVRQSAEVSRNTVSLRTTSR